jgi:hypothetical protein
LTYVYNDSTAVVGPLAAFAEPHTYDLCEPHARSLTAPRGWDLVRHDGDFAPPPPTPHHQVAHVPGHQTGRRGHLRVIPPSH